MIILPPSLFPGSSGVLVGANLWRSGSAYTLELSEAISSQESSSYDLPVYVHLLWHLPQPPSTATQLRDCTERAPLMIGKAGGQAWRSRLTSPAQMWRRGCPRRLCYTGQSGCDLSDSWLGTASGSFWVTPDRHKVIALTWCFSCFCRACIVALKILYIV